MSRDQPPHQLSKPPTSTHHYHHQSHTMTETPAYSKAQLAFFRKIYLAYLIDQGEQNIPSLELQTGMPRRTLQDCIKAFGDLSIECAFVGRSGARNNEGYYRINNWGPISPQWVGAQRALIEQALGLAI